MLRSGFDPERREIVAGFPKSAEQEETVKKIKIKVRFDYKGLPRPARFFIGGKSSKDVAEEIRQQQAAMWRNIPFQGVRIDDVDYFELYSVYDEDEDCVIAFAPLELKATVDSLEDCLRFTSKPEFRRVEFLEPASLTLNSRELEKLFFKFGETLQQKLRELELS